MSDYINVSVPNPVKRKSDEEDIEWIVWDDSYWMSIHYFCAASYLGIFDDETDIFELIFRGFNVQYEASFNHLLGSLRLFILSGFYEKKIKYQEWFTQNGKKATRDLGECGESHFLETDQLLAFPAIGEQYGEEITGGYITPFQDVVLQIYEMHKKSQGFWDEGILDGLTEACFVRMMARLLGKNEYDDCDMPSPSEYLRTMWSIVKKGMQLWSKEELGVDPDDYDQVNHGNDKKRIKSE